MSLTAGIRIEYFQHKEGYALQKEFNNRKTAWIQTIRGIPKSTLTTVMFGMRESFLNIHAVSFR